MKYGSVCSGIEAATTAWHSLGWEGQWFSEIEPFPSAVLKYRYPNTPNFGDMTKFKEWPDACRCTNKYAGQQKQCCCGQRGSILHPERNARSRCSCNSNIATGGGCEICGGTNIDVLVGGTPCQSFSVAGLRKGLDDPRGNLMLTYLGIADKYRPKYLVWENVPGVLSSNGGRDFGTFLGGLGQLGYGFAYRVLDAQHCRTDGHPYAVPQRRRRVFVVGCLGDWRRAAAVLFDSESLSRNPPPSRKAEKRIAGDVAACLRSGGVSYGIPGNWIGRKPENGGNAVEPMQDVAPCQTKADRHAVAFSEGYFRCGGGHAPNGEGVVNTLQCNTGDQRISVATNMHVRRLTPKECERLMGFPDNYTNIPWRGKLESPDGPRYKALGNSMAVNCMRVIGERIQMLENTNAKGGYLSHD